MVLTDMDKLLEEVAGGMNKAHVSKQAKIDRGYLYRIGTNKGMTENMVELFDGLGYDVEVIYRRRDAFK